MSDRKAMKLALDALELVNIEFVCNGAHHAKKDRHGLDEDCPVTMRYRKAITALKERLALQALHDENERLGLYKEAYAQPEPDELNIAYMSGLYDGKKKRPWVGLTVDELITLEQKHMRHEDLSRAIQTKLKQKNGYAEEKNT
jgi:hypothetical protein